MILAFTSCPVGAGNKEEVLVDTGSGMVGIEGGVFLRTAEDLFEESQTMCLLRPQTPPVGLVQPQKPYECGSLLKEQPGGRGWEEVLRWGRRRMIKGRSENVLAACMLNTE